MKLKTISEIASLTEGGKRLNEVLQKVIQRARLGVSGLELTALAEKLILAAGGTPAFIGYGSPPFSAALCVSINSCVVHGIPTDYRLKAGDIVGLDIGMIYEGLYTDMARTIAIDPIEKQEQELIDTTRQALDLALSLVRPGVTTGDIGFAVQSYVERQGFGVVRDLSGHGVGHALHEAPEIPNFGIKGAGTLLEEDMVIAIEPMVTMGDWRVTVGRDNWSIMTNDGSKSAHFEDTLVITGEGCRVLTR